MANEKGNDNIIKASGYFNGYKTKGNFDVQFIMEFPESSLANVLQFVASIGKTVQVVANVEDPNSTDQVTAKLGKFTVDSIKIDRYANSKVVFKSNTDLVDMKAFPSLMVEEAVITLKAKIILENS